MGTRRRALTLSGIAIVLVALVAGCGAAARTAPAPTTNARRSSPPPANQDVPPADAAALRDGNVRFAGRLLATIARGPQNVALSPASISQAVSMAFAGARGATAAQIAEALDFTLPPARLSAAFAGVDHSLA
ncbi:MAG: serpin family protein, partial [Solirubrobacteraceae bacterium]